MISIITAVAAFALVPFGDAPHIFGTRVGLYGVDTSVGPLYVFAFGAIAFYGLMLGGWASGSKYSFLGAMRAAAQLISYEVAQGLALIGVVITAGSLSLTAIVHAQGGMWYFIPQFVGFLVFTIASFAETNRSPFDLDRGRRGARRRLLHRVRRHAHGRVPLRRVPEHARRLRDRRDALPRRLAAAVRDPPADLGRPLHRAGEDDALRHLLHLDPRDAAAPALRPADELRLEDPAAARDAQRARDGDHRGGGAQMSWTPGRGSDRRPARARAGRRRRRLPRVRRDAARPQDDASRASSRACTRSSTPSRRCRSTRASAAATSCTASRTSGLEKCVGCSLCAAACPADCIRVVAAENTPEHRVSAGERYAAVYEINMSRCIFCGYCEVACPFDAITMGHDFELSDYNRSDLIFTKEMLLAEPIEATPLRAEGE